MDAQRTKKTMKNKRLRGFWSLIFLLTLASIITSYSNIKDLKLLSFEFVATTTGLLLGFGITIYTFIMQLLQPIIDKIVKTIPDEEKRNKSIGLLISAENELKQDLWLMFISLMLVLIIGVVSNSVDLKFNIGLHCVSYVPETVYISVYLFSFKALYDLMSSLFSTGTITILLLKKGVDNKLENPDSKVSTTPEKPDEKPPKT